MESLARRKCTPSFVGRPTVRFKAFAVQMALTSNIVKCGNCGCFGHDPRPGEILPPHRYRCQCGYTEARSRVVTKRQVAFELGIHPSMLNRWMKAAITLQADVNKGRNKEKYGASKARFPAQEDELYMRFIFRKKRMGLPIDGY